MQNLKRMQREEARQQQELAARAEQLREQQEKRFNQEKMVYTSFLLDITAFFRMYNDPMKQKSR
jgi:hypothetical protein